MSSLSSSLEAAHFLPNLPGFKAKPIPSGAKKHFFQIVGGQVFMKDEYLVTNPGDDEVSLAGSLNSSSRPKTRPTLDNINVVLTFSAYFEETSSFSSAPIDEKIIRKCNIHYFVETGALSVVEKPQMNSGIPQGTLVRKAVVMKADGTPITPEDFHLGHYIEIYGKKYHIVDCDGATRKYLRKNFNVAENFSMTAPQDPYEEYRKTLEKGPSDDWTKYRTKKNQNKTFMEAQLGNTVNNSGREGFIKYGQKTLRFKCVWDNTSMLYGDRLEFSLVYYLCDDTIEIFSIPNNTMGKDQFTKLLKRSKLPKNAGERVVGERDESDCYTWKDLCIGLELNVYARKLRIIDADRNTRLFYDEIGSPLSEAEPSNCEVITNKEVIDEDAIAAAIAATIARKMGENRVLAFFASILSGGPDDANRRFVISFYVQDGTLKIQEPPVRNSGFVGGLFLSRRQIKLENGDPLTEKHLFVGGKLKILNHRFQLLEANESTLRWMEDQKLPKASFYDILDKIRPVTINDAKSGVLLKKFEAVQRRPGFIDKEGFREVLSQYGLIGESEDLLCEHELLTILRANGNKTDTFNYEKVVQQIVAPTDEFR